MTDKEPQKEKLESGSEQPVSTESSDENLSQCDPATGKDEKAIEIFIPKSISSGGLVKNVFWKFAERFLAQVVSLVVSIVLARILLPNDYGAIAMVTVFITLADVFVTNSFSSALIQKKDADHLDFSSVFYFNLFIAIVLYGVLFFVAPLISEFYEMAILTPVIRVMSIRLLFAAINSVQHAYVSKLMLFKKYFWSTLFGTLFSGIVGITLAYLGYGVWALVAQYMTNTAVDTLVLWFTVKWRPKLLFSLRRLGRLLKFGWKILFESLSNTFDGQVRSLLVGKVYSSADLGYYTKAQQFPTLITSNFATSVSSVLFPAMSIEQDDKEKVKTLLRKAVRITSYVIFPMLTGLAVVAEPMVSVILTDKWLGCVPFIQIFCLTEAATVGMIPRHQALNAEGYSGVFMVEHIVSRVVGLILLFCVYKISILAIALALIGSSVILSLTVAFTSRRYNNYGYLEQIKDILPTLAGCVVMGVPVYFLQYIGLPNLWTLILQIVAGIAIYIAYSAIFRLKEFAFVIGFLKKLFSLRKNGKRRKTDIKTDDTEKTENSADTEAGQAGIAVEAEIAEHNGIDRDKNDADSISDEIDG